MNTINEYINKILGSLICGDLTTSCGSLSVARKVLILSQIGIFSFFAITLLSLFLIYFSKYQEVHEKKEKDLGLLLLGLFFTLQVVYAIFVFQNTEPDPITKGVLSILNSGMLLYSIRYFDIVRSKKEILFKLFDQGSWLIISLILPTVALIFSLFIEKTLIYLPDVALSILIFLIIAFVLFLQFKERKAVVLSVVSVFACLLIIETQIYLCFNFREIEEKTSIQIQNVIFILLSLISLSSIGTIFLTLAFTWVFSEVKKSKNTIISGSDAESTVHQAISAHLDLKNHPPIESFLKIGLVNDGNGKYYFELFNSKFAKPYATRMSRPTNVYKFLLSLALARKNGVAHTIKIKAAGTTIYTSADFNNILIRDLNDKLTRELFGRISKEELLSEVEGNWEISISPENIELLKLEEMKADEQLSDIFQP